MVRDFSALAFSHYKVFTLMGCSGSSDCRMDSTTSFLQAKLLTVLWIIWSENLIALYLKQLYCVPTPLSIYSKLHNAYASSLCVHICTLSSALVKPNGTVSTLSLSLGCESFPLQLEMHVLLLVFVQLGTFWL